MTNRNPRDGRREVARSARTIAAAVLGVVLAGCGGGGDTSTPAPGSTADRVNATGYAWTMLGENIAAGYATANAVMDGWVASPGHCANLMNSGFAEVGVACVPGAPGDRYSTYWTMDLGRPR
jgi:uncharacterized protein YkwD